MKTHANIKFSFAALTGAFVAAIAFAPQISFAQMTSAAALTITPPFFSVNVSPGDSWTSSIRVVNTNPGELPVSAVVTGFLPSGDAGQGTFAKLSDLASDTDALANWITVSPSKFSVPSGGAMDIPFSVVVPKDASPGGHYAAILIGIQPSVGPGSGAHVGVSSFISALIFVRVSGNVQESGVIREFSSDKNFYQEPNVDFTIHFADTGNVHLRPVGQIEIYNAFGKRVGNILVNQTGGLGYVLPSSTRRFTESWQGANSLWDIGEYTAIVTLAYGDNGSKSTSQTLTFWVLPVWRLAEDFAVLAIVIGGFIFFLRRYVRKMLSHEINKFGPRPSSPPVPQRPIHGAGPSETVDLRKQKRP